MYVLESRVRKATASVRRTQLAVVRRKSTKLAASSSRGPATKLGQLTREERYSLALLEPFSLIIIFLISCLIRYLRFSILFSLRVACYYRFAICQDRNGVHFEHLLH
jgi:hypothetical protein